MPEYSNTALDRPPSPAESSTSASAGSLAPGLSPRSEVFGNLVFRKPPLLHLTAHLVTENCEDLALQLDG